MFVVGIFYQSFILQNSMCTQDSMWSKSPSRWHWTGPLRIISTLMFNIHSTSKFVVGQSTKPCEEIEASLAPTEVGEGV